MILYHGSNMVFRMRFGRRLTTQYSFHTRRAISLLKFKEARHV